MVSRKSPQAWLISGLIVLVILLLFNRRLWQSPLWAWKSQRIETEFREYITRITPTHGDVLEVAVLDTYDTLARRNSKSLFDHMIYLGTTVSEIKVKVTYRYHILLSDPWDIELEGRTLSVLAPQVRPSLPPAIHSDSMEKHTQAGWFRFDAKDNLDELERSLTPTLTAAAVTPAKVMLVKDAARKSVRDFVNSWIRTQEKWRESKIENISIRFGDDPPPAIENKI